MKKIDMDYKQWNWKVFSELFKLFIHDWAPLNCALTEESMCSGYVENENNWSND